MRKSIEREQEKWMHYDVALHEVNTIDKNIFQRGRKVNELKKASINVDTKDTKNTGSDESIDDFKDDLLSTCNIFVEENDELQKVLLELDVLYWSVCAHYCIELVLGQQEYEKYKDNEYLICCTQSGWPQLEQLLNMGKAEALKKWIGKGEK